MTGNNERHPYYNYRKIREEAGNLIIILADGPTGVIIDSYDGVKVKLNEKKIYALPIKYTADSFQNDFSNYCNEKINMGNSSPQFKMPILN